MDAFWKVEHFIYINILRTTLRNSENCRPVCIKALKWFSVYIQRFRARSPFWIFLLKIKIEAIYTDYS